jgi:polyhydroxyalkanoate synthase subunit PhaC
VSSPGLWPTALTSTWWSGPNPGRRSGTSVSRTTPTVCCAPAPERWRCRRLDAGNAVPGSFLNVLSALADPVSFQAARYADLLASLGDRDRLATHLRVERWTLDEFPLPARLFDDVVERLYRRDEFASGTLSVTGRQVGPATVTAPVFTVVNPYSRVIPPESILPFHRAAAGTTKRLLRYRGDVGVAIQHVGVLVGRNAHRHLWPILLGWADGLPP